MMEAVLLILQGDLGGGGARGETGVVQMSPCTLPAHELPHTLHQAEQSSQRREKTQHDTAKHSICTRVMEKMSNLGRIGKGL